MLRGTFGNFDVRPRGFCQVLLNIFVPEDEHAITNLDIYGL